MHLQMEDLDLAVNELHQSQILRKIDQLIHFGIDHLVIRPDQGETNLGALVNIIGAHLGDRGIKMVPDLVDHRLYNPALDFQGSTVMQPECHHTVTDYHVGLG